MTSELVPVNPRPVRKPRRLLNDIPEEHKISNDAMLQWLWNQRIAVIENIHSNTKDPRSRLVTTLALSAGWMGSLPSIEMLLERLEGGAMTDEEVQERDSMNL